MSRIRLVALATVILAAAVASPADAVPLFTTNGTSITRFDSGTLGSNTTAAVTGLQGGETLVGIDSRPADGLVYGIGSTSRFYRINPLTGAATQVGTAGSFTLNGTAFGMDFSPIADRIRSVSNTEQNIRINPNDGTLFSADTALNPAGNVVALAFTENIAGSASPVAYAIDSAAGALRQLPSGNGGTLVNVGSLGLGTNLNEAIGFDVEPGGTAFATIVTGGISRLYTINIVTGAATLVGTIGAGATPYSGLTAALSPLTFAATSGTATEGATAQIMVNRLGPGLGAVGLTVTPSAGSATAGDYGPPVQLNWPAGDTAPKPAAIAIPDDATPEDDETFTVTLSAATGGANVIAPTTATVTIPKNDLAGGQTPTTTTPPPAATTPAPPPGPVAPGPDVRKPVVRFSGLELQVFSTALRRGVAFRITTDEACTLELVVRESGGKRAAILRSALKPGTQLLRARLSTAARRLLRRTLRGRRRSTRLKSLGTCRDAAGNFISLSRTTTLRR